MSPQTISALIRKNKVIQGHTPPVAFLKLWNQVFKFGIQKNFTTGAIFFSANAVCRRQMHTIITNGISVNKKVFCICTFMTCRNKKFSAAYRNSFGST
jgi:hypothetical protein